MNMARISLAITALLPLMCSAQSAPTATTAAQAVLTACIESAASGAPVDTAKLAPHFKAASAGQDKRFESVEPLPDLELLIDHIGIFRCTLAGNKSVAKSPFGVALTKKIRSWPGFEHSPLESMPNAYRAPGDAAKGIHRVMVTIENTDDETWTVMVWDARVPSGKAD